LLDDYNAKCTTASRTCKAEALAQDGAMATHLRHADRMLLLPKTRVQRRKTVTLYVSREIARCPRL
jgi:hypothetical protein